MTTRAPRSAMPGRLLRLLSLLQGRREWSGRDLADRLGVTERTLRRDVHRLRELDYPVAGTTGTAGGYRLESGQQLPPLLLDDEEAVAVALALATAAPGIEDGCTQALAKLTRVLPARLRPQLARMADTVAAVPHRQAAGTDPDVLATLAAACRDAEVVTFAYRGRSATAGVRRVEPHHLLTLRDNWYLIGWDADRDDWRTFRVDRVDDVASTRHRFRRRALPDTDPAAYLARSFASARYRYTAHVRIALPAEVVRSAVPGPMSWQVTATGPDRCAARVSADSLTLVVQHVSAAAALGADCEIDADPEVVDRLHAAARHLTSATPTPR
ncbi:helix-turn-helix transcriptional regulator [Actinocatenispora rupis]|uniref:DNA-binding transcriptional regulator n=1 Tax=Actinocatenispora rupis TaxID=519421 RepID=A0A8J3J3I1_9ACTN|nr:WYL domain-containing protein [Actinocatenispora rupis]GID11425.1 DNA-binding transcriptional regulator [Actinocatenispora rupis]